MANKLKNIKCGEFIPTVIDDTDYVELQINDDITIPFTKNESARDGKRDEESGFIMEVVASDAVTAWCIEHANTTTCASSATCATCATCAAHASKAGWTDTATRACTAEKWWEALDACEKSSFVDVMVSELKKKFTDVELITDVIYNLDESKGDKHAIVVQKRRPKCIFENDTTEPPYSTISNGIAVMHTSS